MFRSKRWLRAARWWWLIAVVRPKPWWMASPGFVRPPTPQAFADALARLITDPVAARRMGRAGREHVAARFSRHAFGLRLERLFEQELGTGEERARVRT